MRLGIETGAISARARIGVDDDERSSTGRAESCTMRDMAGSDHKSADGPNGPRAMLRAALVAWTAFIAIALAVRAGWCEVLDGAALAAARVLRDAHPALVLVLRDLSGFGSTTALCALAAALAGWLVLRGERARPIALAFVVLVGVAADDLAKAIVGRVRPPVSDAAFVVTTPSYPSGHAAFSSLVLLVVGALLSERCTGRERSYVRAVALAFALLIGASRIGLGVHWASDVLGGWAFGIGNALLAILLLRRAR
jgi:undecaprenyl-diphosphatase